MMKMACSILLLFSLILFNLIGASMAVVDYCKTPSCNSSTTLSISFPFRLPPYQPDIRCGYSSNFTLSCSNRNQTLIHLPNTNSFAIYSISYSYQKVTVSDPDECLPQRFLKLDLSGSPFSSSYYYQNLTYYNCTRNSASRYSYYLDLYKVPCMSDKNYKVIILPNDTLSDPQNYNCTLIKSNVSAPYDLLNYYPKYFKYLDLYWDEPQCRQCEVCGFNGNTNSIKCQEDTTGLYGNSKSTPVVYFFIVPAVLFLMAGAAYLFRVTRRTRTVQQQQSNHPETALIQTQPTTMSTLNEPAAIDSSNPVFVLGEDDVLLELNTSPCAICLCEYKAGDMLRTIDECNHYFHSGCVDEWLRLKATCPVCRKGA